MTLLEQAEQIFRQPELYFYNINICTVLLAFTLTLFNMKNF